MSQQELAAEVGIDQSAMSRIEQGGRAIRLGEAAAIAAALDVQLAELVPVARDSLHIDAIWNEFLSVQSDLVRAVYEYGMARRAFVCALDALEAQGLDIDQLADARRESSVRGIADWPTVKAETERRTESQNPPYDETIFDAEA